MVIIIKSNSLRMLELLCGNEYNPGATVELSWRAKRWGRFDDVVGVILYRDKAAAS